MDEKIVAVLVNLNIRIVFTHRFRWIPLHFQLWSINHEIIFEFLQTSFCLFFSFKCHSLNFLHVLDMIRSHFEIVEVISAKTAYNHKLNQFWLIYHCWIITFHNHLRQLCQTNPFLHELAFVLTTEPDGSETRDSVEEHDL